jgi:hypothetical protein
MANNIGWGKAHENDIGFGQGDNNNTGWGVSHSSSYSGETVIDTQGYSGTDSPFILYKARVEARGLTVESHDCIINTEL